MARNGLTGLVAAVVAVGALAVLVGPTLVALWKALAPLLAIGGVQ